jgi:bifunctional non-homologous end joining protein LigD
VALNRRADFEEVREFAHRVAEMLARRHPDAITAEQRKDKRGDRIYADVMRNAYAQTVVASYGVRGRPGAPVATPLNWAEVEDDALQPGQFTIETTRARLDGGADPWADFAESRHGLGEAAKRLAKLDA